MENTWKIHGKYMENTWKIHGTHHRTHATPRHHVLRPTAERLLRMSTWRMLGDVEGQLACEAQLYGPIEIVDCPIKNGDAWWFNPSFFLCLPFRVGTMTIRLSYDFWPAAYPSSGPAGGPGGRAAPVKGGFFSRILETICGRRPLAMAIHMAWWLCQNSYWTWLIYSGFSHEKWGFSIVM